jgi:murein L,D-transpeptidase YcbB/YkuD
MTRTPLWMLSAALLAAAAPVQAQPAPAAASSFAVAASGPVGAFYASRRGAPLWLKSGPDSAAARELIGVLRRSALDGFASGPVLAAQAEALIARARGGDREALGAAETLLSSAWVQYVAALRRTPRGMVYADRWAAPRQQRPEDMLKLAAAAPSLAAHVRSVADVNPFYAELRDTAWAQMQQSGETPDPRVTSTLDRLRVLPAKGRYVVVDAANARLWMVDGGRIVDQMKVIVGKRSTQTPMVASVIYYATLNPYWNVPPDLVQKLTAPRVLDQGFGYLKSHGYQVVEGTGDDTELVSPASVDWRAVAAGRATVRVRQLPGPANSMGHIKFPFPNDGDIYLHDTPQKALFAEDDRDLSNGCIRLEDARRFGRWLMGREPTTSSDAPEQHVLLPKPVPIYVTYLTALPSNGQIALTEDVYGRDTPSMAALR